MGIVKDEDTRKNVDTSLLGKLKGICNKHFTKITAIVVGGGIHAYTSILNHDHFRNIVDDFKDGRYFNGAVKISVPFLLPYAISSFSMWQARKENKNHTPNP